MTLGGPDAAVLCNGMRAVDPDVMVGRNPAWKEAWEEDLNDEQRRQVRQAVRRGRRLDESL